MRVNLLEIQNALINMSAQVDFLLALDDEPPIYDVYSILEEQSDIIHVNIIAMKGNENERD